MNKNITIHYFAILREERGVSNETLNTSIDSLKDLYLDLHKRHQLSIDIDFLKVSKNENFVDWNEPIQEGDEIAFIPPVAGG